MGRRGLAGRVLVAAAAMLLLGAVTRVPFPPSNGDDALLRISWRMISERVEECREPTAEELERLPVHMRRDRICERRTIPYDLVVRIDGRTVRTRRVEPSGARGDGPLYVYEEIRVRPGVHAVEIAFEPLLPPSRDSEGVLAPPALARTLELPPRGIALVTLVPGTRVLEVRFDDGTGAP